MATTPGQFPQGKRIHTSRVTWTKLGQGESRKWKEKFMLQWKYQAALIGMTSYRSQGKEVGASTASQEDGGKSLQGQPVWLADVQIHISNGGWACWPAADLLRKACCPQPLWWDRNPQQKDGGGWSKAAQPLSEGCEQTAATISACGLQ